MNQAIDALVDPLRRESNAPQYRDGSWRAAFERSRLFGPGEETRHPNEQVLDAAGLADRVGSVSFVAALDPARGRPFSPACARLPPTGRWSFRTPRSYRSIRDWRWTESMESRLTLVTLGVRDLDRARAFYEALGWRDRASEGADVVFFQSGGMVLGLWDRGMLAEDSRMEDGGGWGGVTLAHNVRSPAEVDAVLAEAARRRGHGAPRGSTHGVGRLLGPVRGPGRAPLGGGPQPGLGAHGGRVGRSALRGHGCGARPTGAQGCAPRLTGLRARRLSGVRPLARRG